MNRFPLMLAVTPLDDGRSWRLLANFIFRSLLGEVVVPKDFVTDYASIPRFLWPILPPWDKYGRAAIIHDFLYTEGKLPRWVCDLIFLEAMDVCEVNWIHRTAIYYSVRLFGGVSWGDHRTDDIIAHLQAVAQRLHDRQKSRSARPISGTSAAGPTHSR